VCPSHFLSTRLQVRHLNGFLQLIAKKTRIYARMCLLGVSMMNNHIYGSKVSQNLHFGGLNRHFKPYMQKIQIAISSDLCIRLTWNLTGSCGKQQRLCGWSRMVVKRPPFWKSIYRHISVKNHPIFMKFCTQQQILNWMNITWSQMKKLHWTDSEFDRTYFLFLCRVHNLQQFVTVLETVTLLHVSSEVMHQA